MFGLTTGETLTKFCDPALSDSATRATKCIEEFGMAVEGLLIKHGKNIIGMCIYDCRLASLVTCIHIIMLFTDEQFKLNRLANAAIDIYCMVAVLSRATRSLKRGYNSAAYEASITSVFCDEVGTCTAL